jgi:hypothetical protein
MHQDCCHPASLQPASILSPLTTLLVPAMMDGVPWLQAAAKQYPGAARDLHFQFYRQPMEVLADSNQQVGDAVVCEVLHLYDVLGLFVGRFE